jgi:hypothetical protein
MGKELFILHSELHRDFLIIFIEILITKFLKLLSFELEGYKQGNRKNIFYWKILKSPVSP